VRRLLPTAVLLVCAACTEGERPAEIPKVPPPAPETDGALIRVDGPGFLQAVRAQDADFVVANVWATWCGPCREEFPYIQSVTRSFADEGVALMFISTDFEEEEPAAIEFLKDQGADLPSYIKTGPDAEFIEALNPEWSGALPTTIVFDDDGERVKIWNGKVEEEALRSTLAQLTKKEN